MASAEPPSAEAPKGGRAPRGDARPGRDRGPDGGRGGDRGRPGNGSEPEDRNHREEFEDTLSGKAARKLKARREGDRGIWFGLGMMGLVGWSVAIPTVAGIAVGLWLDRRSPDPGGISWTLTGLVVGVFLGCLNAWIWVQRELDERR